MKVLVCEDEPVVVKVIQVALDMKDVEMIHAKDGSRALELLQQGNEYDLIITDIHMPYRNGDEILAFVRNEQKKQTPIIMISSDDAEEAINLALKSGVNEYIVKPLDSKLLQQKVKKLLKL